MEDQATGTPEATTEGIATLEIDATVTTGRAYLRTAVGSGELADGRKVELSTLPSGGLYVGIGDDQVIVLAKSIIGAAAQAVDDLRASENPAEG